MSIITAEVAFIQHSLQCNAIARLVGNRVYPVISPETDPVDVPRLVISRISGPRHGCLTGPTNLAEGRFQFDCLAPTYPQAKLLSHAVRMEFDGYAGLMQGVRIRECRLDDERDFVEPSPGVDSRRTFSVQLDFIVMHDEEFRSGESS